MSWHRTALALALVGIVAATGVTGAAGGPAGTKQRIAIEARLNLATGKGTFTLIPLTKGVLKRDTGTLIGGGDIKPPVIRSNGQAVVVVIGEDNHTGKRGTFRVTQRVEGHSAGSGWSADTGTFRFAAGTGSYAGVTGGGAFAAVGNEATGILIYRQEGYISKR